MNAVNTHSYSGTTVISDSGSATSVSFIHTCIGSEDRDLSFDVVTTGGNNPSLNGSSACYKTMKEPCTEHQRPCSIGHPLSIYATIQLLYLADY